jgi:hypothetical protein
MQAWSQFYATIGAVSATLLGLLFVAISINATAALGPDEETSRRLTHQAFQNYLAVMMVAMLALFPDLSTATFGGVTLAATATWSVWVVIRFYQTIALRFEQQSWVTTMRRHLSSLIGFLILMISALCMVFHYGQVYHWFAASTLILLFSATTVSWELLMRIARRKT